MDTLHVGMAQMAPIWLNKQETLSKIQSWVSDAAQQGCELLIFGEGVLPGYPFWVSLTHGSAFNDPMQKEMYAHYAAQAVDIAQGDLDELCQQAKQHHMAIYLGIIERAGDRGGHSLYCSLVYIDNQGVIQSVHRKLQPTYEERLVWAQGDGHGLQVHPLKGFRLGGLNCWENWMPLPRAALYAMGENVHIAVWPGAVRNTQDITRFIAQESRSFVISVSSLMRRTDIPPTTPYFPEIQAAFPSCIADGGSCIAAPDGQWLVAPVADEERLLLHTLDLTEVYKERQNFDPSGHYSRPDITQLKLNTKRQSVLKKSVSKNKG